MKKSTKKNIYLSIISLIIAFLLGDIAIDQIKNKIQETKKERLNYLNISFKHEGCDVRVMQTDAPMGPQITIENKKTGEFIFANTKCQKDWKNPWTEPFVRISREFCDPNFLPYHYTWEDFEKLREKARQLKKAENKP